MVTIKNVLASMTWCGLAVLMGTLYFKPRLDECAQHARVLPSSIDFSYSLWQGCQIEIAPGTWTSWEEVPSRAPHLLVPLGCAGKRGTRCA